MAIDIEFTDQQCGVAVSAERLVAAARQILLDHAVTAGSLSIAVVDDPTIHQINRRHLRHDYATDALSFLFERKDSWLEGEVLISAETAARSAPEYGWSPEDELLLYLVHATLHLVGYDDQQPEDRAAMRHAERQYLERFATRCPEPVSEEGDQSDRLAARDSKPREDMR